MIKQFVVLRRKESLSQAQFAQYWLEVHAPIAKKMPGLRKYVVSSSSPPPGKDPEYGGVAELWFDDFNALRSAWTSPEGQAAVKDTENFVSSSVNIYATEHIVLQEQGDLR